ncbi:hypothetical protein VB773_19675 [Haloarculaceae archaeon H-GB2-1]|nr:hypothetical protein [Haloarculaceae archaeon H-GB1-1]MEA5409578.1 hypothetical protein [Haloarculaceae archaeon H-GB2-1]
MSENQHSSTEEEQPSPTESHLTTLLRQSRTILLTTVVIALVATQPVLAQSVGSDFCSTDMAQTIQNIFDVIQFGGPLLGGTLALGATVAIPALRRADVKRELKTVRNQGVIWGVIVAPMATTLVTFILNTIVAGGSSCSF